MRSVRLVDGEIEFRDDVPLPVAGKNEALVRLCASGVCHSDLSIARREWLDFTPNTTPLGHEGIGVVEALGPGAESYVSIGDRVLVGLGGSGGGFWCGACEHCLSGTPRNCAQTRGILGTFAEYIAVNAPSLVQFPPELSDDEVSLACGGLTAYGAIHKLIKHRVVPGRPVAVIGAAGGLGHYAVQIAKAFGYQVVGIDVGQKRLDFIRSLGADLVAEPDGAAELIAKKFDRGVDATLIFAARVSAFDLGFELLKPGGLLVLAGIPPASDGPFTLDPRAFFRKDPTILYSAVGNVQEMRDLVTLAVNGKVKSHVSRRAGLSEITDVFDNLEAGAYLGRAIITDMRG